MKKINSLIPIVSFSALLVPVWHEWVFYQWLEPSFVDQPQAADYLISALRWLPGILIVLTFCLIFRVLFKRSETPQQRHTRLNSMPIIGIIIMALYVIIFPIHFFWNSSRELGLLVMFGATVWPIFSEYIFRFPRIAMQFTPNTSLVWALVPSLLLYVSGIAMIESERILRFDEGEYVVELANGDTIDNAVLVRNLSTGMLVANPNDRSISFIQSSVIRSVRKTEIDPPQYHRLCEWTGLSCSFEFGDKTK